MTRDRSPPCLLSRTYRIGLAYCGLYPLCADNYTIGGFTRCAQSAQHRVLTRRAELQRLRVILEFKKKKNLSILPWKRHVCWTERTQKQPVTSYLPTIEIQKLQIGNWYDTTTSNITTDHACSLSTRAKKERLHFGNSITRLPTINTCPFQNDI